MSDVVPLLSARREEIKAVNKLYRELAQSVGALTAQGVLVEAVLNQARALGRRMAPSNPDARSLEDFSRVFVDRNYDGGMKLEQKKCDEAVLEMEISRCDYPALYLNSDLPRDVAQSLTCAGEAAFAEGYDPRIRLVRCQPACDNSKECYMMFVWDERRKTPREPTKTKMRLRS